MAQWVRVLAGQHEDLRSNLQHACKKAGVVTHSSSPGAMCVCVWAGAETEGALGLLIC